MSVLDRLSRSRSMPRLAQILRHTYLIGREVIARLGFQVVYASYDSPIPDLAALDPAIFTQPSPMRGIDFDVERQTAFLETELGAHIAEFVPPLTAAEAGPHHFYLRNGTYESVDAELLYGMVRHFAPERVVELGSGFSTLITRQALASAGRPDGILCTYDPYPSSLLDPSWPVSREAAQAVSEGVFRALGAGDILFVDTSHTVKTGGDVNRIVLDLLPLLGSGVIVHFHDVFLPYDYTRSHLEDAHFWTEQYLLQAFLSQNPNWEVLVGASAVARSHPDRLAAVVPSFGPGVNPGAFWIRRI